MFDVFLIADIVMYFCIHHYCLQNYEKFLIFANKNEYFCKNLANLDFFLYLCADKRRKQRDNEKTNHPCIGCDTVRSVH